LDKKHTKSEEEILKELCSKYEIKVNLINNLLDLEKKYQDHQKRRGIFDDIRSAIESDVANEI